MNGRYVVDENGERVGVLLDIQEYELMLARFGEESTDDECEIFDPEEAERRISEFIASADELSGPAVAELADRVAERMREAWRDVEKLVEGKPHNKVLAAELLLSQRSRALEPVEHERWRLSAATSLLGGMMISAPGCRDDEQPPAGG